MPTVRINDINIYYETHGEGTPLLLIPGLSNDVSDYGAVIPSLSTRFKVIALDNRGAGRTDKPDTPYTIEMMADDAAGLLTALDIKKADVVGVSMGGRIALELALEHPSMIEKLVLVSTGPRVNRTVRRLLLLNVLSRVSRSIVKDKYPQPHYAFVRQSEATRNYDCTGRLHEISVPTLILHGRNDRIAPLTLAEEMHTKIKGSKLVTFRGGHLFPFFGPQPFADAVLEFLTGSDRGAEA